MKVCDVVTNSVWFDPRVIKQIDRYASYSDVVLFVVGKKCKMYNEEEVNKLPCNVEIVREPPKWMHSILINLYDFHTMAKAIIKTGAQIIHANDLDALVPSYIAAKKLGAKLIYDTHEIFLQNNWVFNNWFLKRFWGYFEAHIIRKADIVVSVSNAAADYLMNHYNIVRPTVITNCVMSVDERIRKQTKNPGFEVLMHGKFYKGRGYELMVQAAKLSTTEDIRFALRGFGSMESELREYVNKHSLNNVFFYEPVSTRDLIKTAAKSHVGVAITEPYCLNFELSVSNKIFEYAAVGLPIIMSDIPEHRYLNERFHIGIIMKELTPKCLLDSIIELFVDKAFYNQCSQNAILMSDIINWETEFDKLHKKIIALI